MKLTASQISALRIHAYSLEFGEVRMILWTIVEQAEAELAQPAQEAAPAASGDYDCGCGDEECSAACECRCHRAPAASAQERQCRCEIRGSSVPGGDSICRSYQPSPPDAWCDHCGHDRACHEVQRG